VLVGNVFVGLQTVVGWVGLVLIITGLFGTCPVYSLLGISTRTLGEKVGLKWRPAGSVVSIPVH